MSVTLAISFFVMLFGLLLYWFAGPPKLQRIGEIMFAFGLLATLLMFKGVFHLSSG